MLLRVALLVDEWQPCRRALGASGRFEALPLVPTDAWLEAVVNAVVHRSYSMSGDHIRVDVFDDRIEVESPGAFPGSWICGVLRQFNASPGTRGSLGSSPISTSGRSSAKASLGCSRRWGSQGWMSPSTSRRLGV